MFLQSLLYLSEFILAYSEHQIRTGSIKISALSCPHQGCLLWLYPPEWSILRSSECYLYACTPSKLRMWMRPIRLSISTGSKKLDTLARWAEYLYRPNPADSVPSGCQYWPDPAEFILADSLYWPDSTAYTGRSIRPHRSAIAYCLYCLDPAAYTCNPPDTQTSYSTIYTGWIKLFILVINQTTE